MVHYHIIIQGDVQGIGFRYFTQKIALFYGIKGWVRNRPDSSVEIDAEGDEINMAGFMDTVEQGNRFSRIESTNKEKQDEITGYRLFEVIDDKF